MSIKVVVNVKVHSLSIWNLGMLMSLSFCSFGKITVLKKIERAIYFMLFGYLTCLWREFYRKVIGRLCVPMSVLVFLSAGVRNLKNSTQSMKKKVEEERQ